MNKDLIGYKVEKKTNKIFQKNITAFNSATESMLKKETDALPLFFISKLLFPSIFKILTNRNLNLNLLKMVHSEQEVILNKVIKKSNKIYSKSEITKIEEQDNGELLEIKSDIYANNKLVVQSTAKFFVRKGKSKKKTKVEQKPGIKTIFKIISFSTRKSQAKEYALASLDKNPIHTSIFFAKLAGFKAPILQGLATMAITYNALLDEFCENDISNFKKISVKFSRPVYPGESLQLFVYKNKKNSFSFELLNSKEKAVLTNGIFEKK